MQHLFQGGRTDSSLKHTFACCRDVQPPRDRLVGLVVKASASKAEDPGFGSRLRFGDFSGSSHTSDLKVGTPVATLPSVAGSTLELIGPVSVYFDWVG